MLGRLVPAYARVLAWAIRFRYVAVITCFAVLLATAGLFTGGRLKFEFLPKNDAETVLVDLRMPIGTPIDVTNDAVARVEAAAFSQAEVQSIGSVVGQRSNIDTGNAEASATHIAQMFLELYQVELRDRESSQVIESIRQQLEGKVDHVDRLSFQEISGGPAGRGSPSASAAKTPETSTRRSPSSNTYSRGLPGWWISPTTATWARPSNASPRARPTSAASGLTPVDVATQVRGFLFGIDAHTYAAQQEDIDIRVRLDEATRRDLSAVEDAWLVTPTGGSGPAR